MEDRFLTYKNSTFSYQAFGTGARPVICFHGYGEETKMFEFLGNYAGKQFIFYAIDLPYHGRTKWNEKLPFTINELQYIIQEILEQNNFKLFTDSGGEATKHKLTLLGFSLGGRIALSLYQAIPQQTERLLLLAPDGLKTNFWYYLATQTWLGNKLFSFTMKHPAWFLGLLKALHKPGLVNTGIFRFVNYYIGKNEDRRLLYNRWTTLRKLKPDLSSIRSFILKYKTRVRLIYGNHDRIFLSSVGEKFITGIEEQCTITVIHSGHQVLHEKHAAEILPLLFD